MKIYDNQRNSNLEILRILAMLFIVSFHLARHGFDGVDFVLSNPNSFFLYFLGILGKLGVNLFVLISAYFMIKSKFTFRKLLILGGSVYFYAIAFLIIFSQFLTPATPMTIDEVIRSILPITHGYWFIADYIFLMIISPFLNMFLTKLSKDEFLKVLAVVSILWIVCPAFTGDGYANSEMILFVVIYFFGSFIRLHLDIDKISMKKLFLIFSISMIITYLLFLGFDTSPLGHLSLFNKESSIFKRQYAIFIVTASISLFLMFIKRKEFSNKYINYIAGSVLGVYLIHSNFFVSPYLWNKFLHVQTYFNSPNLVLSSIIVIFIVYIVCTLIDIIRRETIEKIWIYIVDKKLNNIQYWFITKFEIFTEKFSYYLK